MTILIKLIAAAIAAVLTFLLLSLAIFLYGKWQEWVSRTEPINHKNTPRPVCPHCSESTKHDWVQVAESGSQGKEVTCHKCKGKFSVTYDFFINYTTKKL